MKIKKWLTLAILAMTVLSISCGDDVDWSKEPNGMVRTTVKVSSRTPKGAIVYSRTKPTESALATIDRDLQGAFTDAISSGYTAKLNSAEYVIFFPYYGCKLSPIQQIPSFELRADVYDGTEFDHYNPQGESVKDGVGVIYAAEMVITLSGEMIACPDSTGAARNGAEHVIIYNNDTEYFLATWFHGGGVYHPLLPKQDLPPNAIKQKISDGFIVRAVL